MKNNTIKIISFALLFMFLFSAKAEAKGFNFRKNILEKQKANVSSALEERACSRLEKIEQGLPDKISTLADSSNLALSEKTTLLQESWAKEDLAIYEKRTETKSSLEKKFEKLEQKISDENKDELALFKNRVFASLEKRNSSVDSIQEEYRNSIFSFLYEYSQNKKVYFENFQEEVGKKISDQKILCNEKGEEDIRELESFMKKERESLSDGLGGNHFREFVEQKRKEKEEKLLEVKSTFEKEISEARRDFTEF